MWLFFGIYSFLTLSVVLAVYLLRLAAPSDDDMELADATTSEPVPEVKKPTPPPPEKKEKPKPKPVPVPDEPEKKEMPKPPEKKAPEKEAKSAKETDVERQVKEQYPDPKITPLMEIVGNWQNIPPKAIPKLVGIKVPVEFAIKEGGRTVATGKLPVGATMSVRKLENGILSLTTGSAVPVTAALSIDETDLKERIQARYDAYVAEKMADLEVQREAERKRITKAIANEESLAVYNDGKDPRFAPFKESLRKGEAGATIELEAAAKWKWAGKETIDGVEYDTAWVIIESETAFGINEKEIKGAMRNDKVEHWFDVRSGQKL